MVFLGVFAIAGAVGKRHPISEYLFVRLGVAGISMGRGFLIQRDPDTNELLQWMVMTNDGDCAVMRVKIHKVKQCL